MKTITKIRRWVSNKGKVFPKVFVWCYASVFLVCGILGVLGVLIELVTKGSINYQNLVLFIKEYFAPSIVGSFALVGVLLIDRDSNGIPDKWEETDAERNTDKQNR